MFGMIYTAAGQFWIWRHGPVGPFPTYRAAVRAKIHA